MAQDAKTDQAKSEAKQTAEVAAEKGRETAATASEEAKAVAGAARDQVGEVRQELSNQGHQVVQQASESLRQQGRSQTEQLAGTARQWADQAHTLAEGRPQDAGPIGDYDVVDFLGSLARAWVNLLDVSEAGIVLADAAGNLHVVASSNEALRVLEVFEAQNREGPCFDAYQSGQPVAVESVDEADDRWPRFVVEAKARGFQSAAAVPLRLRERTIGALNLFSVERRRLPQQDVGVAQALADVATIGILHERALREATVLTGQLQTALDSRVAIEQAKGVVAERLTVDVDDAFDVLRRYARGHSQLLSDVARQVVDRTLAPEELVP